MGLFTSLELVSWHGLGIRRKSKYATCVSCGKHRRIDEFGLCIQCLARGPRKGRTDDVFKYWVSNI